MAGGARLWAVSSSGCVVSCGPVLGVTVPTDGGGRPSGVGLAGAGTTDDDGPGPAWADLEHLTRGSKWRDGWNVPA